MNFAVNECPMKARGGSAILSVLIFLASNARAIDIGESGFGYMPTAHVFLMNERSAVYGGGIVIGPSSVVPGRDIDVTGVLLHASVADDDYGMSLGWGGFRDYGSVISDASIKLTLLTGRHPDDDYFLKDDKKAWGIELTSIAVFPPFPIGLSIGAFKEEGSDAVRIIGGGGIGF